MRLLVPWVRRRKRRHRQPLSDEACTDVGRTARSVADDDPIRDAAGSAGTPAARWRNCRELGCVLQELSE